LIDDLLRTSMERALTPDLFADFNVISKDVDKTEFTSTTETGRTE